ASLMFCNSFHADVHAGNLLVLRDGRIGFIDFGIVGRIKRETWQSVSDFIWAVTQEDYAAMAKSMVGIGMTKEEVDLDRLTQDIENLYATLDRIDPETLLASASVSENEINRLMLDLIGIGKRHGIHFPREFALLLKQLLYFDRYVRLLNIEQNIYADTRLSITPEERWISIL
ncbi:MAG TPA: AarF/UbiB family protein, partial [Pseudomonadales bacterium]|nr:AarF/UbiB family protein [Pseudomonadales bacterium]